MATQLQLTRQFGTEILEHLSAEAEVPVLQGMQRQGDVLVRPARESYDVANSVAVPSNGIPVVRGENGGNTHLLLGEGDVRYLPLEDTGPTSLDLGVMFVGNGATAYLAHPQHGYMAIGEGTFVFSRQRELSVEDELRIIAD